MKVKVFPPLWCNFKNLDDRGWLTLNDGAVLSDALKKIRMGRMMAQIMQVHLNGLREKNLKTPLHEGDTISFFAIIGGG